MDLKEPVLKLSDQDLRSIGIECRWQIKWSQDYKKIDWKGKIIDTMYFNAVRILQALQRVKKIDWKKKIIDSRSVINKKSTFQGIG